MYIISPQKRYTSFFGIVKIDGHRMYNIIIIKDYNIVITYYYNGFAHSFENYNQDKSDSIRIRFNVSGFQV